MFKKILSATFLTATAANAQITSNFYASQGCKTATEAFETVATYSEKLLFTSDALQMNVDGNVYGGAGMFFTNQESGTWTMLMYYDENTVCIVAVGENFSPYVE